MNSTKSSGEKEIKMINFKTNVPELDKENDNLFKASNILEQIGNDPNPTATQFYDQLLLSNLPADDYEDLILAAVSIEMMMSLEEAVGVVSPTIH